MAKKKNAYSESPKEILNFFWWDLLCNLTLRTFRAWPVKIHHVGMMGLVHYVLEMSIWMHLELYLYFTGHAILKININQTITTSIKRKCERKPVSRSVADIWPAVTPPSLQDDSLHLRRTHRFISGPILQRHGGYIALLIILVWTVTKNDFKQQSSQPIFLKVTIVVSPQT